MSTTQKAVWFFIYIYLKKKKKKASCSYCGKETQMKENKGEDLWCHDVCIVDDP